MCSAMARVGGKRDELFNETPLFTIGHVPSILTRWVDDNKTERLHSSYGYATPAAFAAELESNGLG